MSSFRIAVLSGALAIVSAAAFAQTLGRVRGTITAIDGNMLSAALVLQGPPDSQRRSPSLGPRARLDHDQRHGHRDGPVEQRP
jgi:hypothetical protein